MAGNEDALSGQLIHVCALVRTVVAPALTLGQLEVGADHLLDQVREAGGVLPAKLFMRLGRITDQQVDFRRAEVARIDPHQNVTGFRINARLVDTFALPLDRAADFLEGQLDKFADRMCSKVTGECGKKQQKNYVKTAFS